MVITISDFTMRLSHLHDNKIRSIRADSCKENINKTLNFLNTCVYNLKQEITILFKHNCLKEIDIILDEFEKTPFSIKANTSYFERSLSQNDNEDFEYLYKEDEKLQKVLEEKTTAVLKEICTDTCTILDLIPDQEKNPDFYYGQK